MEYRLFGKTEQRVSALGLGTMRLPLLDGDQGSSSYGSEQVDVDASIRCTHTAIEQGINYIDTAYNYMGGRSETIVGQALAGGLRDSVYIATKCPTWLVESEADFDRMLEEQLQALADEASRLIHDANLIGCTGCRYCEPGCPVSIPIPDYFRCYDDYLHGNDDATKDRYREKKATPGVGKVQECLECRKCEQICPQQITITKWLKTVDRLLR